jgi:hypothetical protein
MPKSIVLSVVALCAAVAADHPALGGTWVLDPAHSDTSKSKITSETLAIDQAGVGEASETVTEANGEATTSEISCNTAGAPTEVIHLALTQATKLSSHFHAAVTAKDNVTIV